MLDSHFHDLRHHGTTMALREGYTVPIVMALADWSTQRMMRPYPAVSDQALRAAEALSGSEQSSREPAGTLRSVRP